MKKTTTKVLKFGMSRRRFGSQIAVGALGRKQNPGAAWKMHTGEKKASREACEIIWKWGEAPQDQGWDTDAGFLQLLSLSLKLGLAFICPGGQLYYMSEFITNCLNLVITVYSTSTIESLL